MAMIAVPAPRRKAAPLVEAPQRQEEEQAWAVLAENPPRGRVSRIALTLPSAVDALRANKGRAVLTSLGIIIGVSSVIIMTALGQGASAQVNARLAGLGTNVLTVSPGSARSGGVQVGAGSLTTLTLADAERIATEVEGVERVSPVVNGNAQVIAGNQNWQTRVQGTWTDYQQIQNWQVERGGFFGEDDQTQGRAVAVIGPTVARNLFPNGQDPLGQLIRIRNVPFTVIGVLTSKGSTGFQDQDDLILIPFETGRVRLFGTNAINSISVQAASSEETRQITTDITSLLRGTHRLRADQADDFSIRNSTDIVNTAQGIAQTMTLLLGGVAAVSLVVGGIGIMNIMLVSVTERTREIGIRMAIGARPGDVLQQFLAEAIMLSIVGGLIGIGIGIGAAAVVPVLAGWAAVVSYSAVVMAFAFSALVGIFFGFYPARKASKLNPIEALRYE